MSTKRTDDLVTTGVARRWQIDEEVATADMLEGSGSSDEEIKAATPLGAMHRSPRDGQEEMLDRLLVWAASLRANMESGAIVDSTNWSGRLRAELCALAARYAERTGLSVYKSRGKPGVVFFPAVRFRHGNFQQQSYTVIKATPDWASRLAKPHSQRTKALPEPYSRTASELDSCTSSDALLMNIMCYPGAIAGQIADLLGVVPDTRPQFGFPGAVPFQNGKADATELDMLVGDTIVEAKLTEASFTTKPISKVERYAGLYEVFDAAALPRSHVLKNGEAQLQSYQLIRNVLATAQRSDARFRVIVDARRPDLIREWWTLHGAIRSAELRARCGLVLWQEIAAASPKPLREFLEHKYGL